MTSTYEQHQADLIRVADDFAAELTTAMIEALQTGRFQFGSSPVEARKGTVEALQRRGLIAEDRRWTALGREVARQVLGRHVPSIDDLHAEALGEDLNYFREARPSEAVIVGSRRIEESKTAAPVADTPADLVRRLAAAIERESRTKPTAPITPDALNLATETHSIVGLIDLDMTLLNRIIARAKYDALREVLAALDSWVEGQKSNHEALDHRGEAVNCWDYWHPDDIRRMINDAARATGTREPWVEK